MLKSRLLVLACLLSLPAAANAQAQNETIFSFGDSAYVYVMSNNITANSVAVLRRNFFGGLDKVGVVATGGAGVGVGTTAPPPDPLGAQNELLLSQDGQWLFAVNAGSNQISTFQVAHGQLRLTGIVSSGGTYPVSLAQRGDMLYVLNSAGHANVTAFHIGRAGNLTEQAHSRRLIGTDAPLVNNQPNVGTTAAQLQFDRDQKWLAVTVKDATAKGFIEMFAVDRQGDLADDPVITPSNDSQPFGFTFDDRDNLVVSEAGGNAVSTYDIGRDGTLRTITESVANGQAATCWLATTGKFVYTSNAGSSTVSGYRLDNAGHLQLMEKSGIAARLPKGAAPTDLKISGDGHSLYVLDPASGSIDTFFVLGDGELVRIDSTPVFPALSGMQGLALK
jgi:6-phosphogluconolactonase (cycloisomerase 2 family)